MTLGDAVAKRTNRLLIAKKMTKYRLERNSGITHGALDALFSGKNKTVTLTTVYRLARGFGMTAHEFLDDPLFRSEELEID